MRSYTAIHRNALNEIPSTTELCDQYCGYELHLYLVDIALYLLYFSIIYEMVRKWKIAVATPDGLSTTVPIILKKLIEIFTFRFKWNNGRPYFYQEWWKLEKLQARSVAVPLLCVTCNYYQVVSSWYLPKQNRRYQREQNIPEQPRTGILRFLAEL